MDPFILLKDESINDASSLEFTFPFDYEPHPLAVKAAKMVMEDLKRMEKSIHDFDEIGKMFGVLVVRNELNELGFIASFSGKLQCGNHHSYFVPPIYDMLDESGFYRKGEEQLNQLNLQIKHLENDQELCCLKTNFNRTLQDLEFELEEAKETFRKRKSERKSERRILEETGMIEELATVKNEHEKESHQQQYEIKKLKDLIQQAQTQHTGLLKPYHDQVEKLKQERRELSNLLQQQLFEQYNFLNAKGEAINVTEIFLDEAPPSGTGECAAPKLLQYAYQHQYQPIAMAEFWWGISPPKEIRKQAEFYPACKRKCEPVLGFMLEGLKIAKDPRKNRSINLAYQIIYEDDYLLVINKPAELLSVPGKTGNINVHYIVQSKYPNATGPLLVHRLDQSTSGILLIAKDKDTHAALQQQFESRTTQKRYEAILDGIVSETTGKIELPLRVDLENRPRQLVDPEHGKHAETFYKVVRIEGGKTRIHFFPITGRTHQLRVHAAHHLGLNTPILGDDLYGKRADRLYLHAAQLTIIHPITKETMTFKCEAPF